MHAATLRAEIESRLPAAFVCYRRPERETIPTGIPQIDQITGGVPLRALTEICGSPFASSGKTSVLVSLLAKTSQEHFCALIDASDAFDPVEWLIRTNPATASWLGHDLTKERSRR